MQKQRYNVLLTQPIELRTELMELVEASGMHAISFPALELEILPESEKQKLRIPLLKLDSQDWLLFTSKTGVSETVKIAPELKDKNPSVAVVGEKTANVVREYGLNAKIISSIATSEGLAETLRSHFANQTKKPRLILCRGARSNKALPALLEEAGFEVDSIIVYRTKQPNVAAEDRIQLARDLGLIADYKANIQIISALSSDTLTNLFKIIALDASTYRPNWQEILQQIPLVVIGAKTASTAYKLGFINVFTSASASVEGVVETLAGLNLN